MPVSPLIQTNFTAGELSDRLGGRVDLAAYGNGLAEMLNFIPTVEGPALKRSGTIDVARARDDAGRLIAFEFNVTQAYIIEAGDTKFRFYTNDARIETSPGVAYELTTPWAAAELALLDWAQSNDVMYLVSGTRQQQKLTRTSAVTFGIAAFETKNGPFKDTNTDETITVSASAATGSVTLTASSAIFQAGHVGGLFSMEAGAFSDIPAWEPGITVSVAEKRRYEGRVYQATSVASSGRTGTAPPLHAEGAQYDGMVTGQDINSEAAGGVLWTYLYDRFAQLKITGFTSGTQVTATVQRRLADVLVSGNTFRWAHGAFSDAEGWPQAIGFWNERQVLAKGASLYLSVVGDYENHAARNRFGELTADQALRFTLADPNPIRWIAGDRELIVGTAKAEYAIGATNRNEAVAAGNVASRRQSQHGSIKARPVFAGSRTIFIQRGGRKLREAGYDFNEDRYVAADITLRARHISRSGIRELAYQAEPESLLWAVRGDGVLGAFTYDQQQEVRGWSRHTLGVGGKALSIAAIPDPAGERDDLWILTTRTLGGVEQRRVERLRRFWEDGDTLADAFFADCAARFTSGSPVTTVNGLDWLAGETVVVLADGATHPDVVVSGAGTATLQRAASNVVIGLPYTARLKGLRLEARTRASTSQGQLKRILKMAIRLIDALGLRVGSSGSTYLDDINVRSSATPMDSATPPQSGDLSVTMPTGWDTDGQWIIESWQPLPAMVVCTMPEVHE
jgi:hypothetical protein